MTSCTSGTHSRLPSTAALNECPPSLAEDKVGRQFSANPLACSHIGIADSATPGNVQTVGKSGNISWHHKAAIHFQNLARDVAAELF